MEDGVTQQAAEFDDEQSHIIRRPRLERLLDETDARVILLVAPAGYGKTTLARQWLSRSERQHAWVRARPAIADVGAFASAIAAALEPHTPGTRAAIAARLTSAKTSAAPGDLAAAFAHAVGQWPRNLWLAIDDYHQVTDENVDQFVDELLELLSANVLITARRRPPWAHARRLLYGEILETGADVLAMTDDEARPLLVKRSAA